MEADLAVEARLFRSLILNLDDKIALKVSENEKNALKNNPDQREQLAKFGQQECVTQNMSMSLVPELKLSYADVCRKAIDTRNVIGTKDPSLLLKLRNVASQCLAKSKPIQSLVTS